MSCRMLLIFIGIFLCVCQTAPPIDFFKEDVTIELKDARVRVNGVYYFKNLTDIGKRVKFYYPFPVDSNHDFPDTIAIKYPFEADSAGIYFWLSLGPSTVDSFVISYEQQVKDPFFRYITTTTQEWKRPIKEANFTIIAPETLRINANYGFSEPRNVNGYSHYSIPIKAFCPDEDLIITW